MTREDALNKTIGILTYHQVNFCKSKEAVANMNEIIEALEKIDQEPCGDCISRDAVMHILDEVGGDFDSPREAVVPIDYIADMVSELPFVTAQPNMVRWIPVSERLPDTLKEVIIAFANEPDEYDIAYLRTTSNKTYIANGSKKEWVSSMGETTYAEYEVDAWMPIIPYQSEIPTVAEGSEEEAYSFPEVFGEPIEMLIDGIWVKGKVINDYRSRDGIVNMETADGKKYWCGCERTDCYRRPKEGIVANGELYPGEFDDPLAEEGRDKE